MGKLFLLIALSASAVAGEQPPKGLSSADWSQIRSALEESSYLPEPLKEDGATTLVAANRKQGYRTKFRREGIEIAGGDRETPWRLSLALTGYGHEGDVRPLPDAEPVVSNGRTEYRRGPLTEWYVNRPEGLEQAFVLKRPPPRGTGLVALDMRLDGD